MALNLETTAPGVAKYQGDNNLRLSGLLLQFERLNATDLVAANSLFNEFKTDLERHLEWEEKILFPIFEGRSGARKTEPTTVMRQEHRQIRNYLDQIQAALVQQWPAPITDVLALQDLLWEHNHKEEKLCIGLWTPD